MDEKHKIVWIIVYIVLLVGAVGATGTALYFNQQRTNLQTLIDAAGDEGLVKLVQQHENTISALRDNDRKLRAELESARRLNRELRDINGRAVEIALKSNERFTELETAMDSSGNLIENLINREQRINILVNGLREDNRRLTDTLGVRP